MIVLSTLTTRRHKEMFFSKCTANTKSTKVLETVRPEANQDLANNLDDSQRLNPGPASPVTKPVCVSLFSRDKGCPIMVRFLQSTGLTGFSDSRGSVPAWTLNVLAHACCSDKDVFSVSHLANKSFSVACTQCQYPDEYCTCQ
ncbi:hypothetical protein D9C73_002455 [Collichthys lucidus]|uniref:Uncharacterized protein n=1 Tax=Collichthys lucidus TaxID=240159 RepID=A0A4U5U2R3_COLLU|nr:hypothetical protein D9C73_002455 [Collichthys lucidus]